MKRIILLCMLIPTVALGDNPLACVDPDFAEAFLINAQRGGSAYSTDLPLDFPQIRMPDSYLLVGSERNQYFDRVMYKTGDGADTAVSVAIEGIVGDEWQDVSGLDRMSRGGFQTSAITNSAMFCRDTSPGTLRISANDVNGQIYLALSLSNSGQGPSCSELELQKQYRSRNVLDYMDELPRLILPDGVQSLGSGSGGGGGEYHSHITVTTSMSRESLVSHLGDQVRDQGWIFDTGWSGNLSSGSVWSRSSPEVGTMIGILHAYGESQESYNLRFAVTTAESRSY